MVKFQTKAFSRFALGDNGDLGRRNVCAISFASRDLRRPQAASTTAVSAAISASNTGSTVQALSVDLAPARAVTVTAGGTTGSITAGTVTVSGFNVEGKPITDSFVIPATTAGTVQGTKAFRTVTSISIPQQTGAGATYSVGTSNKLGIGLRGLTGMPVKLLKRTPAGVETMEDASASTLDASLVENNLVTPTTTLDGTTGFRVYVLNYRWAANPLNAQPDYGV